MKIFVMYATAGVGHKKAAEAVYEKINQGSSNEVRILDSLNYTNPLFRSIYSKGYTFVVRQLPSLWGFIYWFTHSPLIYDFIIFFRNFYNFINSSKLSRFLIEQQPEIIVSTHFFANQVISRLKKIKRCHCKLICVVTDFTIHSFWLDDGVDLYTVADQKLKDALISRGVNENKIKIAGIPTKEAFLKTQDKHSMREKLGLKKDAFTALVVTGAIGVGSISRIIKALKNEVQLIVVCGKNKRLFNKLNRVKEDSVRTFGFVDNIHELMAASDIILTKAGGLTIAESLVKGLPLILFNLIPGQESDNARLMKSRGVGVIARNVKQIKDAVLRLKSNPLELEVVKKNIDSLAKPDAASDISKLIK